MTTQIATEDDGGSSRLEALARANAVRSARAELKRAVAAGEISAAAIVSDCPESAEKWSIGELLLAQRRWGHKRCARFLERTGISATKPIGTLTERQRLLVVAHLTMLQSASLPYEAQTADLRLSEHVSGFDLDIRPVI